jgi:hypothetical protein
LKDRRQLQKFKFKINFIFTVVMIENEYADRDQIKKENDSTVIIENKKQIMIR